MSNSRRPLLLVLFTLEILSAARASATVYDVPRANSPVTMDGAIEEEAWDGAVQVELNFEVEPGENIPPPGQDGLPDYL